MRWANTRARRLAFAPFQASGVAPRRDPIDLDNVFGLVRSLIVKQETREF